jgi:hypothetical protein
MTTLELTAAQIKNEITAYWKRIEDAKQKLDDLQHRTIPWKKRKDQERALKNEIKHVEQLITYAKDALALMDKAALSA